MRRIAVYCGSSAGARPDYAEAARRLGTRIARRGAGLVYGGGHIGLMGVLADAALEAGAEVIGVIPEALVAKELAHRGLTELRVVHSMHERKAAMADLAEAFVAMPGGLGTLEELFEVWTWAQLGFHDKPCGLLDVAGYWTPLVAFLDRAVTEGFVGAAERRRLLHDDDPDRLLDRLEALAVPRKESGLDREAL